MHKSIFSFIICILYLTNSNAQEITERRNRLTDSVIERFYVLKSDQSIKHGLYRAYYQRKILIASGNYDNGKRIGDWDFYDPRGKLIEQYDYDTHTYKYEGRLDTGSYLSFVVDKTIKKTDVFTRPVKIGGIYFGFIPYVSLFNLPFDALDVNTNSFRAYVELLISPGGRLADYKVHLYSDLYQYNHTITMDVNLFSEADRTFVPGTLNGEPVLTRLFIKCWVTPYGNIDFY